MGTEKDSQGNIIAYTRDNKGNLVSERTSSESYHYLFDGLGSVVGLMNSQENLVDSYVYDPYGVTEHQTGTQYNPWQFASGYFDSYTLYYKYGTRYYDRFGRWTQKDPVPSANPYVYANDDPVNAVDPSGRNCFTRIVTDTVEFLADAGAVGGAGTFLLALLATATGPAGVLAALATIIVFATGFTIKVIAVDKYNDIASVCGFPQWDGSVPIF